MTADKMREHVLVSALMVLMFLPVGLLLTGFMPEAAPAFIGVILLALPSRYIARFGAAASMTGGIALSALATFAAYLAWGAAPYLIALSAFALSVCFTTILTTMRRYGGGRFLSGVFLYIISAWIAGVNLPARYSSYMLPACAVFLLLGFIALNREALLGAFMSSERYRVPRKLTSKNARLTLVLFGAALLITIGWQPIIGLFRTFWAFLMTLTAKIPRFSGMRADAPSTDGLVSPGDDMFGTWDVPVEQDDYIVPYIMLAMTLALFAVLIGYVVVRIIRSIPAFREIYARLLKPQAEADNIDEREDISDTLRTSGGTGGRGLIRRLSRRIRFDKLSDNRKKVRAALGELLKAAPDELRYLTPSELKAEREAAEQQLMDDYNTARYSENPVSDSAAENARDVFSAYKRHNRLH